MSAQLQARFVLVRPRDPNNIGAAARAMGNFGFRDLAVVDPWPPVWREARSAVGAGEILRKARLESLEAAISGCGLVVGTVGSARLPRRPSLELPGLAALIGKELGSRGRAAVLFGNEKTGLSNREISLCHVLARIPTAADLPSMNLGQAVAVVAYELKRGAGAARLKAPEQPRAPAEQETAVAREFLRAFDALGYMRGVPEHVRARKVQDALKRLRPCKQDAGLLLAVLRRIGPSV
jgi:tRNA/rRNA methyltransferase